MSFRPPRKLRARLGVPAIHALVLFQFVYPTAYERVARRGCDLSSGAEAPGPANLPSGGSRYGNERKMW